ncbi:CBO0543 family protein [Neobacillus rhizosphaerae]|uniref:CBO0543 family protein n=1 Tax=Neobacillus rhizosphaerae TaxID=2880965 RepID=UPI003D2C1B3E
MSIEHNYWKWIFLIISILIFNIVAIKTRKRLPRTVIYSTIFFALCIQQYFDSYATFFFKAWGFFSVDTADFPSLLVKWGIYPAVIVIIINWYPYKSSKLKKFFYIMGWSVFSTAFEWMTIKLGILWHIHWNLFNSFIIYPIIYYLFLILHVKFYQWLKRRESS